MSTPVIFIHGLWLHATSWTPWIDLFEEAGYAPSAPGWPGDGATVEESRANPDSIAGHGIDDVVEHYAKIINGLPERPILIGHSFGGMIAQKLLGMDLAVAAVAIDAAQIKGVLPVPLTALRSALPVFRNPANRNRAVSLTEDQFRYAFGNAVSEEESGELYRRWSIPAPGKPLFEAATANFDPHSPAKVATGNEGRGPLLLITGGRDHTVPEAVTLATLKQYRHSAAVTDFHEFPDRAHSLTIDSGWREVADVTLAWLARQSL
ncbi:alpha/beta fold hydrolase [Microbispora sp. RL4-1S]|uniref:Alpha/beta fold hydrolase n=1 Tax=Microbispora oryzae TaxID=2806554 RepID=A0A940WUN6_9ACTN|nr:alpha/beta fold hydrolase [Microbispora oryzae]MBP2707496.1 alpha/beta fold hydrolase [Microbispora oryzae]